MPDGHVLINTTTHPLHRFQSLLAGDNSASGSDLTIAVFFQWINELYNQLENIRVAVAMQWNQDYSASYQCR
jgi:hypothetical protein